MDQYLGSSTDDRLPEPVPGGRMITTAQRAAVHLEERIAGWGSDLERDTRPGVPRDKAPELGGESLYPQIEQQPVRHTILKSTEHGRMTPVFGTSVPLRGVSGWMRRGAYTRSEGRLSRWMILLAADRVDVVEALLLDLARLRLPNIGKEMGLKSEVRFNRRKLWEKVALATTCVAVWIVVARVR